MIRLRISRKCKIRYFEAVFDSRLLDLRVPNQPATCLLERALDPSSHEVIKGRRLIEERSMVSPAEDKLQ